MSLSFNYDTILLDGSILTKMEWASVGNELPVANAAYQTIYSHAVRFERSRMLETLCISYDRDLYCTECIRDSR